MMFFDKNKVSARIGMVTWVKSVWLGGFYGIPDMVESISQSCSVDWSTDGMVVPLDGS